MILDGLARCSRSMLTALGLALGLTGCTTFDDAKLTAEAPGYLSLEDGARVCSLAFSCPMLSLALARSAGVAVSASSYSSCLHWLASPLPTNRYGLSEQRALLQCVAKAKQCSEALACAWFEPLAVGDLRCAGQMGDRCDSSDLLVDCDKGVVERCLSPSYTAFSECRLGLGSEGRCAISGCIPDVFGPARCEDGAYLRCDPLTNLKLATDCHAIGQTCKEGAVGASAVCTTADGLFPCDMPGDSTCSPDGKRARVCDGSSASEFDCAAIGEHCVEDAEGARCAKAEEQCTPLGAGIDVCAGNLLTVCVGGQTKTIDCAAMGLSCLPQSGSQSGRCN